MSRKDQPEQDKAAPGAADKQPGETSLGRDESSRSDSSRPSSVGAYLADEIGALDSMRHEEEDAEDSNDTSGA